MGKTIKDMPYEIRRAYKQNKKLTRQDVAILTGRARTNKRSFQDYLEWRETVDECLGRVNIYTDWYWGFYRQAAPKWFRKEIHKSRKMTEKTLIAHERYDDLPKWKRNAAWYYW